VWQAWLGTAWFGVVGLCAAGMARHGEPWWVGAGSGVAWQGVAGKAWRGEAGYGLAGMAWRGPARRGLARSSRHGTGNHHEHPPTPNR